MTTWNREGADVVNMIKHTCRRCLIASGWSVVITVEVKMRQNVQGVWYKIRRQSRYKNVI